jgi:hypothetical protein
MFLIIKKKFKFRNKMKFYETYPFLHIKIEPDTYKKNEKVERLVDFLIIKKITKFCNKALRNLPISPYQNRN